VFEWITASVFGADGILIAIIFHGESTYLHFSLSVFVLQLLKNSSLYVSITAKTG
jgi:hypothetical protein